MRSLTRGGGEGRSPLLQNILDPTQCRHFKSARTLTSGCCCNLCVDRNLQTRSDFSCVSVAEWSDYQQGHRSVLGSRNVQRCQLWPSPGGPEMLRSEVDDTKLD